MIVPQPIVFLMGGGMKSSNIGGQAVLEGIMMKNGDRYAVAVRKPDKEIEVSVEDYKSVVSWNKVKKIPFIRGIFNFVDSLVLGMKTITYSASFYEDEEEEQEKREKTEQELLQEEKKEKLVMSLTMVLSVVLAIAIFMVLPNLVGGLIKRFTQSRLVLTICEGALRVLLFLTYIWLVSKMEDIQRTFMYHGAEHKCINCIEHGLELNVENVRISSRQHKRCGTSFLFFVMIVSIVFGFFITTRSAPLRALIHIALLPLIAGVSYEIIRLAGSSENPVVNVLSKPGLLIQNMTTREPDDSMIEVAICAVEAVFDWKVYIKENFGTDYGTGDVPGALARGQESRIETEVPS